MGRREDGGGGKRGRDDIPAQDKSICSAVVTQLPFLMLSLSSVSEAYAGKICSNLNGQGTHYYKGRERRD